MHRGAGISRLSRQQVATVYIEKKCYFFVSFNSFFKAQYKTKGNEVAEESMKQVFHSFF